jgi:hypothetical protein
MSGRDEREVIELEEDYLGARRGLTVAVRADELSGR